ncbi:hypothetical protein TWF281_000460 [Arthrobotrys megalospora]
MPSSFDNQILAYAKKYDITLSGPKDIAGLIRECEGDTDPEEVNLPVPESNNGPTADPFGFTKSLKKYKSDHGPQIGGEKLDITTFSSRERKDASYDNKDPLGRREINAIKQGMVFALG